MKKSTKLLSILLTFAIIFTMSINTFASQTSVDKKDNEHLINNSEITVVLPENSYFFNGDTTLDNADWIKSNVEYPDKCISLAKDMGALAMIAGNDGKTVLYVERTDSSTASKYYNFDLMEKEDFDDFIKNANFKEENIESTCIEYKGNKEQIFIELNSNTIKTEDSDERLYVTSYFTMLNGYGVAFSFVADEVIDESSKLFMQSIVDNLKIEVVEKPEMSVQQATLILFLLIGLTIIIIVFFIFTFIKSRKEKKENKIMAERTVAYRNRRKDKVVDNATSEFVNVTEITDAAIKNYSIYQCFINKILAPAASIFFAIVALIFLFLTGAEWWMLLLMAAVTVYCIFKVVTSATYIEKTLKRFYKNMRTRSAKYAFYDDEFSIMGIESNEFHPYFQVREVREYKEYYYIYFGNEQCYFIKKDGFIKGNAKEFRDFISRKTGKRF